MSLPQPVGRQTDVLYLAPKGHNVVLGTAGSGKTTMAIHRAVHLADPAVPGSGRTLLLTFNRALVTYLRHLSPARMANLTIEHYEAGHMAYTDIAALAKLNGTLVFLAITAVIAKPPATVLTPATV